MKATNYRIFTPNDLKDVKKIWVSLAKETKHTAINTQWEWVETWVKIYADVVDCHFFVAYKKDTPVGITLLSRETSRPFSQSISTVHIGTNGEPLKDCIRAMPNALLVKEKERTLFLRILFSYLLNEGTYDEIVFDEYKAEEIEPVLAYLKKNRIRFSERRELCQQFNLKNAREEKQDPLDYLGKNVRHGFRRTLKDLGDDTQLEWAQTEEQALDILQDLISFYEDKWVRREGRGSMFHSEKYTAFHKELVKKFMKKGKIMLTRLHCERFGKLACSYFYLDGKVAYGYQVGQRDYFDLDTSLNMKKLKLGFVLHMLNMRACLAKGLDIYNHTMGGFRYKIELSNEQSEIVTLSIKRNLKPHVRQALFDTYEYIDSHKKFSKILWFVRKVTKK